MKKALIILLALCMVIPAGCRKGGTSSGSDEWEYVYTSEVIGGDSTTTGKKTKSKDKSDDGDSTEIVTSQYKSKGKLKVDSKSVGKDPDAKYDVKGDVTVAVSSYRLSDYEAVLDAFHQVYPNVDITIDYRPNNGSDDMECTNYLATRAAAGSMPDVIYDDAGRIWNYVAQGWLEPLDSYVANDASWKYVPTERALDCTYNGKLYAIPYKCTYSAFVINLDTLEHFNIKHPSLTWNIEDFTKCLKAAADKEYSGAEILLTLPAYMSGAYDPSVSLLGYDVRNKNWNKMTNSYGKARKLWQELISYPNLESYQLRFSSSNGSTSDYIAKFGSDSNMAASFHLGKTLLHEDQGTWSYDFIDSTCSFDWELWPYPQITPGVIPLHVDTCYLTKASKNKEAAFQLLRYMTYSTEGIVAALSQYDDNNKTIYKPAARLMYPVSTAPEVIAKFKSLPQVDERDLFWFEHIKDGYRADDIKIVPDWDTISSAVYTYVEGKDKADVDSLMPGLQEHMNKLSAESWANFNKSYSTNNK